MVASTLYLQSNQRGWNKCGWCLCNVVSTGPSNHGNHDDTSGSTIADENFGTHKVLTIYLLPLYLLPLIIVYLCVKSET